MPQDYAYQEIRRIGNIAVMVYKSCTWCVYVCVPPVVDSMDHSNGQQFSTHDQDNDGSSQRSCSQISGGGGWWYGDCRHANLNGQSGQGMAKQGINWYHWKNSWNSYKASRILLRPISHTGWWSPPSITSTWDSLVSYSHTGSTITLLLCDLKL